MNTTETSVKEHWNNIYTNKAENELSWFQQYPKTSIEFTQSLHLPKQVNIIDIGGGDSHFADVLLDKGYTNIWVLDISSKAIERAKKRLGQRSSLIHWVTADVLDFIPPVAFDLWHDRAAFHFLDTNEQVSKYVALAARSIRRGGHLIIGTFSERGPRVCSGLEVSQYNESKMTETFQEFFKKIQCIYEDHSTPSGKIQNFLFCSFQKL